MLGSWRWLEVTALACVAALVSSMALDARATARLEAQVASLESRLEPLAGLLAKDDQLRELKRGLNRRIGITADLLRLRPRAAATLTAVQKALTEGGHWQRAVVEVTSAPSAPVLVLRWDDAEERNRAAAALAAAPDAGWAEVTPDGDTGLRLRGITP